MVAYKLCIEPIVKAGRLLYGVSIMVVLQRLILNRMSRVRPSFLHQLAQDTRNRIVGMAALTCTEHLCNKSQNLQTLFPDTIRFRVVRMRIIFQELRCSIAEKCAQTSRMCFASQPSQLEKMLVILLSAKRASVSTQELQG
jgi:hypothetical protein